MWHIETTELNFHQMLNDIMRMMSILHIDGGMTASMQMQHSNEACIYQLTILYKLAVWQ